jgi:hypothetical protein
MDPAYGSIVEVGGLLGSGAEMFPAQRFSVGFDVGVGMTGVDDSARFCVFASLVTRFYFL